MKRDMVVCPFCGYEMISGEIWVDNAIGFAYEAGPSPYQNHSPALKHLSIGSTIKGTRLDACVCRRCKKLVVDCEPKEVGLIFEKLRKKSVWD